MNRIIIILINYLLTILCFISIYFIHQLIFNKAESTFFIAAFGASAVLVFSTKTEKYSFLKICLCSVIAALIGVFFQQLNINLIYKVVLTISSCILLMDLFYSNYPPAGAIAIIPLLPNKEIQSLGYFYAIYPTLSGLIIIYTFSTIRTQLNTKYYGK